MRRTQKMVTLCLLSGVSMAVGSLAAAQVCPTQQSFMRGSDTLQGLINTWIGAEYTGTGTGNGENDITTTNVGANPFSAPKRTVAGMSRSFKRSLLHKGGFTGPGGAANLRMHTVAADGVSVIHSASFSPGICNLTIPQVRMIYGGVDGSGGVATCDSAARRAFVGGGIGFNCAPVPDLFCAYRRDDASGTTDVFKAKTGIVAFCNGTTTQDADPIRSCPGGKGLVTAVEADIVAPFESATEKINRFVRTADQPRYIGFVGLSGTTGVLPSAVQSPSSLAFVQPDKLSIRLGTYPLARALFMNQNTSCTTGVDPQDAQALNGVYNCSSAEITNVIANGFFTCAEPSTGNTCPLDNAGLTGGVCFSALQDGNLDPDCLLAGAACTAGGTGASRCCASKTGGTNDACVASVCTNKATAAVCNENQECASGHCSNNCTGANCATTPGPGTCVAKLPPGSACTLSLQCASNDCIIDCPNQNPGFMGCKKGTCS